MTCLNCQKLVIAGQKHICAEYKMCPKCSTPMQETILFTGSVWDCHVCSAKGNPPIPAKLGVWPRTQDISKCKHNKPHREYCRDCWDEQHGQKACPHGTPMSQVCDQCWPHNAIGTTAVTTDTDLPPDFCNCGRNKIDKDCYFFQCNHCGHTWYKKRGFNCPHPMQARLKTNGVHYCSDCGYTV